MIKNMFFTVAAAALFASATLFAPVTADAAMGCKEMAKAKYPSAMQDMKDRRAYKKACKEKAKMLSETPGLMGKFKFLNRRT